MVVTTGAGDINSPGKGKRAFRDVGNVFILIWMLAHMLVCVCVYTCVSVNTEEHCVPFIQVHGTS